MSLIHATAVIDPSAQLGVGVSVGAYAIIGADVHIGDGCVIGPHAVILGPTRMGRENRVWQFASIGDAPQDLKYRGERTSLEIGDRNQFRECCTVSRGTSTGDAVTRIGSDNLFMAYTHVAHDCVVGSHCVMANYAGLAGHVELDDWVILGGYAGVHQFCKVGAHAFLANNATETRDVPPFLMVAGTPAVPKGINLEGLKRRGFTLAQVSAVKAAYKALYRSGLKLNEATDELKQLAVTEHVVQAFVDFLPRVTRSLVR